MFNPGFNKPQGIDYSYWDLADDRCPFFAYGGPEKYANETEHLEINHVSEKVNLLAAKLMRRYGRDSWQAVQSFVVRMISQSGDEHALTVLEEHLGQVANGCG